MFRNVPSTQNGFAPKLNFPREQINNGPIAKKKNIKWIAKSCGVKCEQLSVSK